MTSTEYGIECPHCHARPKGLDENKTWPKWGHPRQSPAKPWANILSNGAYMVRHRNWLDHLWRYRDSRGSIVFVAEPYEIDEDDLDDLALLRDHGWCINFYGDGFHHPDTIRIHLSRPTDEAA